MDRGGIETLLMNIYRKVNRAEYQFDFLTHPYNQNYIHEYENEILSLGGKIYKAPRFSRRPLAYQSFIKTFFRNHPEYNVVHAHNLDSAALAYMQQAKEAGCYLIAHSHNTDDCGWLLKRCLLRQCRYLERHYPDHFFACSTAAARFAFGNDIASSSDCDIIHNGIDIDAYALDEAKHRALKSKLFPDICGPLFGTVGRLSHQKNQTFLLDVFAEILKLDPSSALAIIGKGELRDSLEEKVQRLGIASNVRFVGSVPNVPEYLAAFDVFLLPSLYEGLPLVSIEAQAAGLPCLFSEAIPELALCTDCTKTISLDKGVAQWAELAMHAYRGGYGCRNDRVKQVRKAGFDISEIAGRLCSFYSCHAGE